jgi:hypothetical protein
MKNSASKFRGPEAKIEVQHNMSLHAFCGIHTCLTRACKIVCRHFMARTHRKALRDPQVPPDEKHKFGVSCPDALCMETVPVPPEHEKYCIDVSRPGSTRTHYVTRRSNQMQKHKFGVMCHYALLMEIVPVSPEHEK